MNGAHDMGGAHGFGPVIQENDEPPFHEPWEERAFALTLASGAGYWNLDTSRFARENTPPADYLARSYYEMWTYGLEKLVVETGMVTASELDAARRGDRFDQVVQPSLRPQAVEPAMRRGGSARVDEPQEPPARFAVGDRVQASVDAPATHTRCPRYVRGRIGTVERDHGIFVFPDTNAHGRGPNPQRLYSVRFEARDLWGDASQGGAVFVDLFDDYLAVP